MFSVIVTLPLKNINGGEHYLKEELEATLSQQSFCYDHQKNICGIPRAIDSCMKKENR